MVSLIGVYTQNLVFVLCLNLIHSENVMSLLRRSVKCGTRGASSAISSVEGCGEMSYTLSTTIHSKEWTQTRKSHLFWSGLAAPSSGS